MVMGWEHLKTENINESIQEIIRGMAGGNAAHQVNALKFGLYSVIRQNGSSGCPACRDPVSYISLGNGVSRVRRTNWGRRGRPPPVTTVCSECGHSRTDYSS